MPSPVQNVKEELGNYGKDKDIQGNVPEEGKGLPATVVPEDKSDPSMAESDQVQPCNLLWIQLSIQNVVVDCVSCS